MSLRTSIASVVMAALLAVEGASAANSAELPRGSPDRTAALLALRPVVEADVGQPVEFAVERIDGEDDWVAVVAKPIRVGQPLDWSNTRHAAAIASGAKTDTIRALLLRRRGTFQVVEYVLGARADPTPMWTSKYGLPRSLTAPSGTTTEPIAPGSSGPATAAAPAAMPHDGAPPTRDVRARRAEAIGAFERFEKSRDADDWKRGYDAAEAIVALEPRNADNWRLLAHAYAQGAAHVGLASTLAEEAYDKAIELEPRNARTHLLLAGLLLDRQSFSRALDHMETAVALKPDLATSALVAGMCRAYQIDRQVERGAAFFTAYVVAHPRPAPRLAAAILLHELGRTAEALPHVIAVTGDPAASTDDATHAIMLLRVWRR